MEVYAETILKLKTIKKRLKNCNINSNNINDCLYKLNALSKDLDQIILYIKDLATTAAEVPTRQAPNKALNNTPTAPTHTS